MSQPCYRPPPNPPPLPLCGCYQFTCWDVGGKDKIRPLWRHYYQNTDAVIFVVDANDRDRMDQCRDELHRFVEEGELLEASILIFANKQDLPRAMPVNDVCDALQLGDMLRGRMWTIQACCATTGDGLYEGLSWLQNPTPHFGTAAVPAAEQVVPEVPAAEGGRQGGAAAAAVAVAAVAAAAAADDTPASASARGDGSSSSSSDDDDDDDDEAKEGGADGAGAKAGAPAATVLARRSFKCVELTSATSATVAAALAAAAAHLSSARRQALRDAGGDTSLVTTTAVTTQLCGSVFASETHGRGKRSQLRLEGGKRAAAATVTAAREGDSSHGSSTVVETTSAAWHALAQVGRGMLPHRGADDGALDLDATALDAFWYGAARDADGGEGGEWACAPHTDASVLTLVVSDAEHGLECLDVSTGAWVPMPLGRGKCAVLVGRAGGSAACKHRVRKSDDEASERTSITLDLYDR